MTTLATPSRRQHRHSLAAALYRFVAARLRGIGMGRLAPDWEHRAAICESCHLRVIRCGISYCGKPYLEQTQRDLALEGCGCPCRDKARDPGEHCPIDAHHNPAVHTPRACTCKWCQSR